MDADEMWWTPFERAFETRLMTVDDAMPHDMVPRGDGLYIFTLCTLPESQEKNYSGCADAFLREHKNYTIVKDVGTTARFAIFLARRK